MPYCKLTALLSRNDVHSTLTINWHHTLRQSVDSNLLAINCSENCVGSTFLFFYNMTIPNRHFNRHCPT